MYRHRPIDLCGPTTKRNRMTSPRLWIWCFRRIQQFTHSRSWAPKGMLPDQSFCTSNTNMPTKAEGKDAAGSDKFHDLHKPEYFMIVGLGNHGFPANSRHSVGMRAADKLAFKLGGSWEMSTKKYDGSVCHANFTNDDKEIKLILFKPKALMNISGSSVAKTAKLLSISACNIVLIHDELDKSVGKFHLKEGGSARGHNGVSSCMDSLRSNEMLRLRIGIGRPASKSMVVPYVLSSFTKEEQAIVDVAVDEAVDALVQYIARKTFERRKNPGKENAEKRNKDTDRRKRPRKERLKGDDANDEAPLMNAADPLAEPCESINHQGLQATFGEVTTNFSQEDIQNMETNPKTETPNSFGASDKVLKEKKHKDVKHISLGSDDSNVDR